MIYEFEDLEKKLKSPDSNERQEACYYLSKIETKQSANLLAQALADPDFRVRNLAKKSLERLKIIGIQPDPNFIPKVPKFSLSSYTQIIEKTQKQVQQYSPSKTQMSTVKTQLKDKTTQFLKSESNQVKSLQSNLKYSHNSTVLKPDSLQNHAIKNKSNKTTLDETNNTQQDQIYSTVNDGSTSTTFLEHNKEYQNTNLIQENLKGSLLVEKWQVALENTSEVSFYNYLSSLEVKEKLEILSKIEKMPQNKKWAYKLKYVLQNEKDPFVISKLVKVFGIHYGPGVVKYVSDFLEHEDERVIANTLESLALAGGKSELELIMHYLDHPAARIRSTAANCLWQSNPSVAFDVVKQMAKSPLLWEREAAKFALKNCPLPEAKDLLTSIENNLPKLSSLITNSQNKLTLSKNVNKESTRCITDGNTEAIIQVQDGKIFTKFPIITKILNFPVAIGLENPIPLWMFFCLIIFAIIFFFYVALPIVDWFIPPPPPEI